MQVVPISCLRDNYAYLIICETTRKAIVVDPSQAGPIVDAVLANQVTLTAIWNTHHHWDHIGGNNQLLSQYRQLEVVGHQSDKGRIPGQTTFVNEGDGVRVGDSIVAQVIHNPGHTAGAISFYVADSNSVFSGDTLFTGGCGRLFEGTPQQMRISLEKLGTLPPATKVYCGHEYAENNLRFAATVEPNNPQISDCLSQAISRRKHGQHQPSTIGQEKDTNPFLRTTVDEVVNSASTFAKQKLASPNAVFAALRQWKDQF